MFNNSNISALTDEDLLSSYKGSDDKIYIGELFNRYLPLIYGVCLKYLEDTNKAADAVIQLFNDLLHTIAGYEIGSFRPWIYGVAKNYCSQILQNEEPFIQVDIDGDDADSDNNIYPSNNQPVKELKKYISNRTRNHSHRRYLQLWTVIAFVAGIIGISVIFFLSIDAEQNNSPTPLFASAYPISSHPSANSQQENINKNIVTQKDTVGTKKQDKKGIVDTKKSSAPIEQKVLPVKKEELKVKNGRRLESREERDAIRRQLYNYSNGNTFSNNGRYPRSNSGDTPSNREIQALLSGYGQPKVVTSTGFTQTPNPDTKPDIKPSSRANDLSFNGYIQKNRKPLADSGNMHGKVTLMFTVNDKGRPTDIVVLRSLCPEADQEAVRLLKNGPDWAANSEYTRVEIAF